MTLDLLAIALGATLGAWLRWGLTMWLNPRVPSFPLGTLAVNLVGGYLIGLAVAFFLARTDLPVAWRLFAITGFLGGLTTFSTFSAEVTDLLAHGDYGVGLALAATHLVGSVALTVAGFATYRLLAA